MSRPSEAVDALEAISAILPWEASFERSEDFGRTQIYVFKASSGQQPDLVAKHDRTWGEGDALSVFEAQGRVSLALASSDRFGAPRALGWSAEPPVVIMEMVNGEALSELVRDAVWSTSEVSMVIDAVGLSGQALAALHESLPAPTDGDRDVIGYAERMFRQKSPGPTRSELPSVCRMNDYATYNQYYDIESGLALLDPPVVPQASVPHDDVGYFLSSLMHSVVGSNGLRHRRSANRLFACLAEEFLDQYSAVGSYDLRGRHDRELVSLIAAYHAANWGWRRRQASGLRMASLTAIYWAAKSRVVPGPKPWLAEA